MSESNAVSPTISAAEVWRGLQDTLKTTQLPKQFDGYNEALKQEVYELQKAERKTDWLTVLIDRLRGNKFDVMEDVVRDARFFFTERPQGRSYLLWALASLLASLRTNECVPLSEDMYFALVGFHLDEESHRHYFQYFVKRVYGRAMFVLRRHSIPRKSVWNCYRDILLTHDLNTKLCYIRPNIYVLDFCERLQASVEVRREALNLARQTVEKKLHIGRNPKHVAAALVYIAFIRRGLHWNARENSKFFRITDVTLQHFVRILKSGLH